MRLEPTGVPRAKRREPGARLGDGRVEDDAALLHHHHPIGNRERAVDPLLGEDDGALRLLDRGEECLGTVCVELGRRLVEQQELRSQRERRREADALQLSARELDRAPAREVRRADLTERDRDLRPDLLGRDGHVLETERDLVVDARHHDLVLRVLEDRRDDARQLGRPVRARVQAADLDPAGEAAAVEVRHEARERAQERRLAAARRVRAARRPRPRGARARRRAPPATPPG